MPTVTIDNREIDVAEGTSVLDAAREIGIDIPTLCHLPGRPAQASCFLCMVQIKGMDRMVPACGTPVTDGMVVESDTDSVLNARRTAIELLLSDHLGDCLGPCTGVCPARMDIPRMIRQIADGRDREALITVKEAIPLPAVLGRICPELCEKGCRRAAHDGSVSICMLKRYVADEDLHSEEPYLPPCLPESGRKVAIVGTGPAGLSAAYYLRQLGHACVLYDDHPEPGGMLRYGVPEDKLPREVLDAEIDLIRRLGAQFRCGVRVGGDVTLDELRAQFDAVLLTVGDAKLLGALTDQGATKVDKRTLMTAVVGVFAAGGAVTPSRHAIKSLADGRDAAESMNRYFATLTPNPSPSKGREASDFSVRVGKLDGEEVRTYLPMGTPEGRLSPEGGWAAGFSTDEARREAMRCLRCDCAAAEDCQLRQIAIRLEANPLRYRAERREYGRDESHPLLIFESGKCIACGICVRLAAEHGEKLGLAFTGRGITMRLDVPFRHMMSEGLRHTARACAEACPTMALTIRNEETTAE